MFRKKVLREKEISADNKEGFLPAHLPWQKTAQNEGSSSENVSASGEKSDTRRRLLLALAVTMATASAEPLEDTNSEKVPGDETPRANAVSTLVQRLWRWTSVETALGLAVVPVAFDVATAFLITLLGDFESEPLKSGHAGRRRRSIGIAASSRDPVVQDQAGGENPGEI